MKKKKKILDSPDQWLVGPTLATTVTQVFFTFANTLCNLHNKRKISLIYTTYDHLQPIRSEVTKVFGECVTNDIIVFIT